MESTCPPAPPVKILMRAVLTRSETHPTHLNPSAILCTEALHGHYLEYLASACTFSAHAHSQLPAFRTCHLLARSDAAPVTPP